MEREALLDGLVQPGGRAPAPGSLRIVQAFVNTVDREHGPDLLDSPDGLREWLERHLLAAGQDEGPEAVAGAGEEDAVEGVAAGRDDPVEVGEGDVAAARAVREALRGLLLANNGEPYDPSAREVLERAARRSRLEAAFPPDGAALVPRAGGVDAAVGRILAAAFAAMLDGTWRRLKACPRDACGWAFYDRSSNASAHWCSMRICGGRVKAGAYYRRRRAAGR